MPVGDDHSLRAAKALALPTRSAILAHLLKAGSVSAREIADQFSLHPNVARAHLDLLVEAGFLATGIRRQPKGRPAKVYFTWEGEPSGLEDVDLASGAIPEAELLPPEAPPQLRAPNPHRLLASLLVKLVDHIPPDELYPLAEQVARREGAKLMHGYRTGGLDFAAAVRALVEELHRFSNHCRIVRLEHDYAEIETLDCPFADIALEHPDLVVVLDVALKEGAMAALGHPSDVDAETSVASGDPLCHESIRRRTKPLPKRAKRQK